jgi:hypothetical protein
MGGTDVFSEKHPPHLAKQTLEFEVQTLIFGGQELILDIISMSV